ncbi:hypothetical protein BGY98DRAFT_1012313 [Russula aff. rugulosa BPL654]|nr:hypothetical protein BGY98DRAFT_1012313 [Russula aff. rugulosa BPL654]
MRNGSNHSPRMTVTDVLVFVPHVVGITRITVDKKGMKEANDPQLSLTDWMNYLRRLSSQKHGHPTRTS